MFDGDRSRCTIPSELPSGPFFSCAKCTPAAASIKMWTACSSGIAWSRSASAFMIRRPSSPWRYSIVKKKTPPCSPMSWTWAMLA